ncbi:MAG: DUF998 domain-containing protein [Acidobacteriaceae bacterium]
MLSAYIERNPVVLSYLALRKAVGIVAILLPVALAAPWWVIERQLQCSISGYYHTGMRNLFVGSLCAIALFMFCCRGYDRKDEIAGIISSICAIGVAFFPTSARDCAEGQPSTMGIVHYVFAAVLFGTLAYFCLVLFRMTAPDKQPTQQKLIRNRWYTGCGCVILVSMLLILVYAELLHKTYLFSGLAARFTFESTALVAFGIAWLIKGETFLKDERPQRRPTITTDGHLASGDNGA